MKLHPAERVAEYTAAGYWGHESWFDLLAQHARNRPDAVAVTDPLNLEALTGDAPRELTWSGLASRVDTIAAALVAAGVRRDDVVGIQLPNGIDLTTALLAVPRAGAIAMPFAVQLGRHEISHLAATTGMSAFIGTQQFGVDRPLADFLAYRDDLASVREVFALGGDLPDGVRPLEVDAQVAREQTLPSPPEVTDCVTICLTSGTESAPKAVPRTMNDWRPMALASVDAAELTGDDVLLNPFPMVNMAGIAGMFVPWLLTGATLVHHHPFDPQVFFAQLAKYQATYTVAPPALLMMVLARDDIPPAVFSSLRFIGSGSAPLTPAMTQGWTDKFGIEVINAFGSNEGACLAGYPLTVPDRVLRARQFPRYGSPEHEWPNRGAHGMRTRIVDADGIEVTAAQQPGELRIKGPGVFAGYLGAAVGDAFDDDGYFRTGDVFEYAADEHGDLRYLRYVDRLKDIVVRGGQNISAAEVESLLSAHPAVQEVAVIGLPDDRLGERACAVVVPAAEPPTLEELTGFLREQGVAAYKLPEELRVVEALPRNPVGKVLKRELRDQHPADQQPANQPT